MKYSPYEHGVDVDLFPTKEPPRERSLWKWILVIGFCLFFIYRSTFPVLRLQSDPPPEFVCEAPNGRLDRKEPEKVIAQAYWNVAVHSIQAEYSSKQSLPSTPPPEFKIDSTLASAASNMDVDRVLYWQRLRDVWSEQETWQVSYGWSLNWVTDFLDGLGHHANQSVQQFVQSVQHWKYELGHIHTS